MEFVKFSTDSTENHQICRVIGLMCVALWTPSCLHTPDISVKWATIHHGKPGYKCI